MSRLFQNKYTPWSLFFETHNFYLKKHLFSKSRLETLYNDHVSKVYIWGDILNSPVPSLFKFFSFAGQGHIHKLLWLEPGVSRFKGTCNPIRWTCLSQKSKDAKYKPIEKVSQAVLTPKTSVIPKLRNSCLFHVPRSNLCFEVYPNISKQDVDIYDPKKL